ncbi:MAG: Rieske (2Fe-2S) protein [Bacteroidota bacterium]
MNRKDFIKTCGLVCLGGTAMSVLIQGCTGTQYALATASENKLLTIKKTEFEKVGKKGTVKKQYVLIKPASLNFPVCIYPLPGDQYSAVLLECTHNGCELQPQGDFLVCPCHGSEFSKQGLVQSPPAENNLKTFKITSDHENIYLQL